MEKEISSKLGKAGEARSIKQSLSQNCFSCRENSEILANAVVRLVNTFFDHERYDSEELIKDAHGQAEAVISDSHHSAFLSDEKNVIVASKIASSLTGIIEDFGSVFFSPEARGKTMKDG